MERLPYILILHWYLGVPWQVENMFIDQDNYNGQAIARKNSNLRLQTMHCLLLKKFIF